RWDARIYTDEVRTPGQPPAPQMLGRYSWRLYIYVAPSVESRTRLCVRPAQGRATADPIDRKSRRASIRSRRIAATLVPGTRTWPLVSRSRRVTVPSSRVA